MSNSLWCVTLQPNQPHAILCDGLIHLTRAILEQKDSEAPSAARGTLTIKIEGGQEHMICTLQGDITESQQLNLCISKYDQIVHLCASGPSPIVVMGQLYDLGDDDEDDADFMLDEDDEEEDSTLQFRDPSDERFLGGFELHHFGLGEPTSPYMNDHINLREQEDNPEEAALHDRIVQGLINSMLNSGNQQQIAKAKKIKAKLSSKKARR